MRLPLALVLVAVLSACSREQEPVANQFESRVAEIENKARELEAEVANQVSAAEAEMQNDIDALNANANLTISLGNDAAAEDGNQAR